MKIATYNINGIKARINALSDWLKEAQPDVALLQEIKSVDTTLKPMDKKALTGSPSCRSFR